MTREIAATVSAEGFLSASGVESLASIKDPLVKKRRSWIPSVERMPPIIQFAVHAMRWCKSKCATTPEEGTQLRLIGHLALGAKRNLALVEIGGVRFLVGGGAESVTVIVPVPLAADVPSRSLRNAAATDRASKHDGSERLR